MAYQVKHTAEQRDALLGEVFDAQLQTKDVEVTESGTIKITADDDYLALKEVNVNVNVQGGGGGSNWRYFSLADNWGENQTARIMLWPFMQLIHFNDTKNNLITSAGYLGMFLDSTVNFVKKIAFDANTKLDIQDEYLTWHEFIATAGISEADALAMMCLTEITKEEFYAI